MSPEPPQSAVAEGHAPSISAWVDDALRLKVEHERRRAALVAFIAAREAEHGVITDDEIRDATRRARGRAVTVRGATGGRVRTARRGRSR